MELMDKSEFKKLNKDHAERQAEDIIEELTNKINKNGFYYNDVALDEYISMGVALLIADIIKIRLSLRVGSVQFKSMILTQDQRLMS
jgi:hypothetical protein